MLLSELIIILEDKKNKYWDVEVMARTNLWYWDYMKNEINWILHNWEDWCFIELKNYR